MRKSLAVALLALVFVFSASLGAFGADLSGTVSTKTVSKYLYPCGTLAYDKRVQQTELFVAHKSGVYFDLWSSYPWNKENNFGKEADYTLGWSGKIERIGAVADVGVFYIDYIDVFHSTGDMISPFAKVSREWDVKGHLVAPYLRVEFPFPVRDGQPKKGNYTFLGVKHTLPTIAKLTISQDAYALYDSGAYAMESGWIGKYNLAASYPLTGAVSVGLEGAIYTPLSDLSDRRTEKVWGANVLYAF